MRQRVGGGWEGEGTRGERSKRKLSRRTKRRAKGLRGRTSCPLIHLDPVASCLNERFEVLEGIPPQEGGFGCGMGDKHE